MEICHARESAVPVEIRHAGGIRHAGESGGLGTPGSSALSHRHVLPEGPWKSQDYSGRW